MNVDLATVLVLATGGVLAAAWSVKLVRLAAGLKRASLYWSQPQGDDGGLLYVSLGDSAAQGVGASHPERGYVGLLAERLRTTSGMPVRVVNLSRSGARISDVLERQLPLLRGHRPDLVTVAIGGNDVWGYDAHLFASQVDRLTAALPVGAFIADVPYFMHGHWERAARHATDAVTSSARSRGLTVVQLHEALRRQGWSAMLNQFAADWFHPNDRGYRVWADAFWAQISPVVPFLAARSRHGQDAAPGIRGAASFSGPARHRTSQRESVAVLSRGPMALPASGVPKRLMTTERCDPTR